MKATELQSLLLKPNLGKLQVSQVLTGVVQLKPAVRWDEVLALDSNRHQ